MAYPFKPADKSSGLWSGLTQGEHSLRDFIAPIQSALSSWNRVARRTHRNKFLFEGLEPRLLLTGDPLVFAVAAIVAGLSNPIWLLIGSPFILTLVVYLWLRLGGRR